MSYTFYYKQTHPSRRMSIGLLLGVCCSSAECHCVFLVLIPYLIMIVMTIIGTFMAILFILNCMFRLSVLSYSLSANAHLPGCFCPWTFLLNIELNMLPPDSFVSCLDSLQGYSTGEFHALQLIVLAVSSAVD